MNPEDRMNAVPQLRHSPATPTRREVLAGGIGLAAVSLSRRRSGGPRTPPALDDWFWPLVQEIEVSAPVGGPSAGRIDNSLFGVEAPRAGRMHPSGTPPAVTDFCLRTLFEPRPTDASAWEVGFIWRVSAQMDALWWSVSSHGQWSLDRAVWEYSPRNVERDVSREFCGPIDAPVLVQAVVIGSLLACSVNGASVLAVSLPEGREPGHVGILANAHEDYLRPTGVTPYSQLSLWSLDSRGDLRNDVPDKFPQPLC